VTPKMIENIAATAANKYARRCRWADRRDLEQEALAAVYDARRRFDPARGRPEPFFWSAAVHAIRRWLWSFSAPVKQTSRTPAALSKAPLNPRERCPCSSPEERAIARQELCRAAKVLGDYPLGARVLVGEQQPAKVAKEARLRVDVVYAETGRARAALREIDWEEV
jgi:hypothetical protein